jgi:DNA-binding CsgD family transcriptional regulator
MLRAERRRVERVRRAVEPDVEHGASGRPPEAGERREGKVAQAPPGARRVSDGLLPHFGVLSTVGAAENPCVDAAERKNILSRYLDHSRRFDEVAARRNGRSANAEVIPLTPPLRELEQEPTMREIEVLQLISDGLVNREIGQRLFLSEETVKSHVRHLLAKLQARSRAHAVAIGFRRGLIA